MTDNVVDINTRRPVERVGTPEGESAQQFMRRWAKTIKDGKFNNVAIIVMDGDNYCDFGVIAETKLQEALFCLLVDDVKQQIIDNIFGYEDIEEED